MCQGQQTIRETVTYSELADLLAEIYESPRLQIILWRILGTSQDPAVIRHRDALARVVTDSLAADLAAEGELSTALQRCQQFEALLNARTAHEARAVLFASGECKDSIEEACEDLQLLALAHKAGRTSRPVSASRADHVFSLLQQVAAPCRRLIAA